MENNSHLAIVEALILASPEPIPAKKVAESVSDLTPAKISQAVTALNERYATTETSFRIREVAGGYQFYILPDYSKFVEELFTRRRKLRLTRAALETLAIVSYRQPVTKFDIEHIRGVSSDGVLHNLLEKKLINIKGRSESVGRPMLYVTTDEFLKFFGINSLEDLPEMSEIEDLIKAAEPDSFDDFNVGAASPGTDTVESEVDSALSVDNHDSLQGDSGDTPDSVEENENEAPLLTEEKTSKKASLTIIKEQESKS